MSKKRRRKGGFYRWMAKTMVRMLAAEDGLPRVSIKLNRKERAEFGRSWRAGLQTPKYPYTCCRKQLWQPLEEKLSSFLVAPR